MNGFATKALGALAVVLLATMLSVAPALGGGMTDRWAANALRDSGRYGGLDTWAYNALHAGPADVITEHSLGQNPVVRIAAPLTVAAAGEPDGFSFRDAGIGAAVALGAMLVGLGSLVVHRRRVLQPSA